MDDLLPLLKQLLPPDAVVMTSLRQLRSVLGVKRPARYYACRSGKCFLRPLDPKADPLKISPCNCKHPWFEEVRLPNGTVGAQPTGQVCNIHIQQHAGARTWLARTVH